MDTPQKDLSYYRLRLQELINTSFPENAHDQKFIEQRSSRAADAYQEAFLSVNSIEQCNEIADCILFEGLYFSKFDTVFQAVCNEFETVMADEELRPFALKMLTVCAPVFSGNELADDFANRHEYDLLYTELMGTIAIWIEENGLQ